VSLWTTIGHEAWNARTPFIVAGLFLTIVCVRLFAVEEKKRVRAMVVLTVLHLILVPVVGALRYRGAMNAYDEVWLACMIFGALAVVGMSTAMFFGFLLPRIGLRTPRILRDVIAFVGSVVWMIAIAKQAGFPLTGLITTSAVLTAVIGFSMQDTLGNIMGGLALQMDNSVQVGDWVKVGDVNGKVSEIRWRYTAIETRNWETVIIPNSVLMKGQVTVLGRRQDAPLQWRRWVWFNVDYRYQPSDVTEAVTNALTANPIPRVAADPKPGCILMDFHESYGRYAVRYFLTDIAVDDPTDSEVRTRIWFALKRAGIPLSIPAHAIFMTEDNEVRRVEKAREERDRRMRALTQVDLFDPLSDEERQQLADGLSYAPFTRGEVMTRQGAEAHWLYMIVEGNATVRVAVDGGLDKEVAKLDAGQFFGEMSLMTGERRSATVVANCDVECYRLDKGAFQGIMRAHPELAERVAEILARRRVELIAAKEGLDAAARERRMLAAKVDLVDKIRNFFGLGEDPPRRVAGM
jgi:small-conductance mechanosensitive channel/CRP-like cAMP-binding protein